MTIIADLALLIQSRYPLIAVETVEEQRFERTLQQVAESLRVPFYEWSLTEGLRRVPATSSVYDTHEPLKALNNIAAMTGEALFFMKDLRRFLDKPEIVRRVLDIAPQFAMDRRVIVLLAAKDALPAELHMAEAMAPCVLMIDEIEKGLSYSQSSESDAGLSRRIFGRLLGWLQDRRAPVFVIATSNAISQLPPELTRKGRFDEIFFIDLPTRDERKQIFTIHLKKRGRNPADFDLDHLATAAEGFTGAEIEQVVVAGLYTAFSRGVDVSTAILTEELQATKPLSVTRREEIESLRAWGNERAVRTSCDEARGCSPRPTWGK